MIAIFPLWTFHWYVTTFQQYLHMDYISLSWSDIPELVVFIRISWKRVAANRETTKPMVPIGQVEVITSKDVWSTAMTMTWLIVTEYLCHKWPLISFTCRKHSPVLSSFIIRFVTIVARRVPLVEKELLILPEKLSSPRF